MVSCEVRQTCSHGQAHPLHKAGLSMTKVCLRLKAGSLAALCCKKGHFRAAASLGFTAGLVDVVLHESNHLLKFVLELGALRRGVCIQGSHDLWETQAGRVLRQCGVPAQLTPPDLWSPNSSQSSKGERPPSPTAPVLTPLLSQGPWSGLGVQ